jgi:protocatechuate 3,4-dioxygenase beta subunit
MALTNDRPTHYQGRPLVRPDDEIVDQGLGFDVATLLGRRQMLRAVGLGAVAVGLAACTGSAVAGDTTNATTTGTGATGGAAASTTTAASSTARSTTAGSDTTAPAEIPDETAGPYPGDGSNGPDALQQSGIIRSDLTSSFGESSGTADGVPITLELTIADLQNGGVPFAGVAVYVWHCDREGRYSMYSGGVEDENYLRGVQVAGSDGVVRFTSIFPACYSGRWPHIHFEVYPDQSGITDTATLLVTSQVALPKDACAAVYAQPGYEASVQNLAAVSLQSDNVFGDDGGALQLATVNGDTAAGYAVSLRVGVDTSTTPSAGGGSGAGPGGRGPGG